MGRGPSVSEILQILARLESDRLAGGDRHLDPGLGVAPHALLAVAHLKDSEAAELDALAIAERIFHGVDDGIHGLGGFHPGYVRDLRNAVYDIRLDHECSEAAQSLTMGPTCVNETKPFTISPRRVSCEGYNARGPSRLRRRGAAGGGG